MNPRSLTLVTWLVLLCAPAGHTAEQELESGPVRARIQLEPDQATFGDLVTLTLTAEAEPEVQLLMPQFGEALDAFVIREFIPRREITPQGKTLEQQTYRLETRNSGDFVIPSLLIEYIDRRPGQRPSPPGQDAYELLLPALTLKVRSVLPTSEDGELRPPRGQLPLPEPPVTFSSSWYLLAALMTTVALGLVFWYWLHRTRRLAQRTAYELAREALNRLLARPLPGPSEMDSFFVSLSAIVRNYIEQRFGLRAPELTTEEFLDIMSTSPQLIVEHRQLLQDFLRRADLVKFARVHPGEAEVRASLAAADRFLEETRDFTPTRAANGKSQTTS